MRFVISSLLVLISFQLKAQILELKCPMPKETYYSKLSMEIYFTDVNYKDKRVSSGTDNIPLAEVQPVDNEIECSNLRNVIHLNSKYKKVDEIPELRKFFYKTDNFYFVFWRYKVYTVGGKMLFLVIKKDFSKTYEFYL